MKVLITSGGTKIKIDRVRSITNMSKGTFGSRIAEAFYDYLFERNITFLGAYDSKMPRIETKGFRNDNKIIEKKNGEVQKLFYCGEDNQMKVIGYDTFEDYKKKLFDTIIKEKPDVIVLAAAVSDYGVDNYVDGKIRTSADDMVIRLKPLPKLISKVRELAPNSFIVGFKLLVDSTEEELKQACVDSMNKNKLDMIVGNDLRDIQNDNHTLMIGTWENENVIFEKFSKNENKLPLSNILVMKIFKGMNFSLADMVKNHLPNNCL